MSDTRIGRPPEDPEARFRSFTEVGTRPDFAPHLGPCLLWTGGLSHNGYGRFWFEGKRVPAHRWVIEFYEGPIEAGSEPDHLCRVRNCIRRSHLEVVTKRENLKRAGALRRGTRQGAAIARAERAACPHGHPYDADNTAYYKGSRVCRTCKRAQFRKSYYARKVTQ